MQSGSLIEVDSIHRGLDDGRQTFFSRSHDDAALGEG
jgi:hypothetical protein